MTIFPYRMSISIPCHDKNGCDARQPWLVLAHCFNLDGRAASQTITDRIPFLMKKGVMPVVMSASHGDKALRFPHYRIMSPAPSGILFELRYIINKKIEQPFFREFFKGMLLLFCLPFLVVEKIFIRLDSHWSWFLAATCFGLFLIRKYRPSLIYSTAGPSSTHWAGYLLSRMKRLPWIAELHDPLVYDDNKRKGQRCWFDLWLEKVIFEKASAVIYFSEIALKRAEARHHVMGKGHVLRPGADPPGFSSVQYRKRNRIHFGHFGSLAKDRNLSVVIEGLHAVLMERPLWRDKIRLDVYGCELDPKSERSMVDYSLEDVVIRHGRLEYDPVSGKSGRQRIMEAMRQCDVLLVVHGEGPVCEEYIPSKLYEYMLTRRPILGFVARNTELERMLTQSGHVVVAKKDKRQIRYAITDLVLKWESGGLGDVKDISIFTVEGAVNNLLKIAMQVASTANR